MFSGRHISGNWTIMGHSIVSAINLPIKVGRRYLEQLDLYDKLTIDSHIERIACDKIAGILH